MPAETTYFVKLSSCYGHPLAAQAIDSTNLLLSTSHALRVHGFADLAGATYSVTQFGQHRIFSVRVTGDTVSNALRCRNLSGTDVSVEDQKSTVQTLFTVT